VAIRTVLVDKKNRTVEYGAGGGIVWDSENKDELQEYHAKSRILVQAIQTFLLLDTIRWKPMEGCFMLDGHGRFQLQIHPYKEKF
jgi:para-aminobenzoate synthetase / 4-amino-4-deoxychorismate lyase